MHVAWLFIALLSGSSMAGGTCLNKKSEDQIITEAASHFGLPRALLCAVRKQEAGKAGQCSAPNKNGSRDCGPMQINNRTVWVKELAKRGISYQSVIADGCINIWAGAWILAREIHEAGTFWSGVGNYHSRTKKYKHPYIRNVYDKWVKYCQ